MELIVQPKVFFTGTGGFLVSNFIDYIRSEPEDFEGYSFVFGYHKTKPDVADIGEAVKCDLYNPDEIDRVFAEQFLMGGIDLENSIIIHTASVVGGINFHIEHPADVYYGINRMDGNIVEAA